VSRPIVFFRATLLIAFLLVSGLVIAQTQNDDWHLTNVNMKAFFTRSAFAHGYMHGYEEGFHHGDLDLQMARPFQQVKSQAKYKKVCGYRSEFGDRSSFEEGYRKGYPVGYTDAFAGRNFRAIQLVKLARIPTLIAASAAPDNKFDRAFIAGYENGQQLGLHDGRAAAAVAALDSIDCTNALGSISKILDYCEAYRGGYRLGYSDGYTNQHDSAVIFARK